MLFVIVRRRLRGADEHRIGLTTGTNSALEFDTSNNQWTEFTPLTYPANVRRGVGVDSKNNVWFGIYAAGNRPGKLGKIDQTTGRITECSGMWAPPRYGSLWMMTSPG